MIQGAGRGSTPADRALAQEVRPQTLTLISPVAGRPRSLISRTFDPKTLLHITAHISGAVYSFNKAFAQLQIFIAVRLPFAQQRR
ncbi:hypothetical protein EVAR_64300_1 [Eumeta japonica]|uniref:Uncharacterized protein n=1 Tax=Eumeta variegata TaxID=151549 RepID=A0A4C1ZUL7_EUMVA|nr:hypothetical protein EVAR_64300_1 [Eumeta japonica]